MEFASASSGLLLTMTRYIKWQRLKEEELVKTAVCGRSVRLLLPTLLETAVLGHREPLPALITFRNTGRTCPVSRYFILAAPDAPPLLAIQRFGILYIHHIFKFCSSPMPMAKLSPPTLALVKILLIPNSNEPQPLANYRSPDRCWRGANVW